MRIVHLSYARIMDQRDPTSWLAHLDFFTKDLEVMGRLAQVESIHLINYSGITKREGVTYHFLKLKWWEVVFPFRLHFYVRSLYPDVILVHGLIFPWQVLWLGLQMKKKTKIGMIHHAEKPLRLIKGWVQKLADRFIDVCFFTSMETARLWVESGQIASMEKVKRLMVGASVFHPVDRALARTITRVSGQKIFLWVGGLNTNKDPETLIRGFQKFLGAGYDATLYIIYKNDYLLAETQALLQSSGYMDRIFLVGKIEHEKLLHWYNSADFIISTSHSEGSGVAMCEAMSCGCIPIVTSISSHHWITDEGKCGLLFRAGSSAELAEALVTAMEMNISMEGKKVIAVYNEKLSPEATAGTMMECFKSS